MYGKRGRLGLLITAVNSTLERDFHRVVPDGVSVHTNRISLAPPTSSLDTIDALCEPSEKVVERVLELKQAGVGVVLYGCTSGSFAKGPPGDQHMQQTITEATGVPFITTTAACVEAINALGIRRLAIATPYPREVNERLVSYLQLSGIEVSHVGGIEEPDVAGHAAHEPEEILELGLTADRPNADGLFISCTQLRGLDTVAELERRLAKPVVSANQASIWKALGVVGVRDPVTGFGSLLERPR